ncbi:MAG: phosphotransferase, partial [Deltaproteobacteria bacterium]|nr:phosphotransferase [Deltaproteobacteria bacterium]
VFPWVPGRHIERSEVSPSIAAAVGAGLAGLHRAGDQVAELPDRFGIYTTRKIVERARGFRDSSDPAVVEVNATLTEEARWLMAQPEPADLGIIHGDLFRDNVLFAPDGQELVALLDFEQASLGSRVYDLAVCINAWCFDQAFDSAQVAAMVGAYGAVDERALWVELRRSAWRFTVTRITDVYLPGIDLPDKDFRRYARRLQAWRELGGDGLGNWLS